MWHFVWSLTIAHRITMSSFVPPGSLHPLFSYLLNSISPYCPIRAYALALHNTLPSLHVVSTAAPSVPLYPPSKLPVIFRTQPKWLFLWQGSLILQAGSVSLSFAPLHAWFYLYGHSFAVIFQTWHFTCLCPFCNCEFLEGWDDTLFIWVSLLTSTVPRTQ